MNKTLNYLVAIEGNETLLERFIEAIDSNTCKVNAQYPEPLQLSTGEKFLSDSVITYYFQTRPFNKSLYIAFFDKLHHLIRFNNYSYCLGKELETLITKNFNRTKLNKNGLFVKEAENLEPLSLLQTEILSFFCYLAVGHIKYGASYETVTAEKYFDIVHH